MYVYGRTRTVGCKKRHSCWQDVQKNVFPVPLADLSLPADYGFHTETWTDKLMQVVHDVLGQTAEPFLRRSVSAPAAFIKNILYGGDGNESRQHVTTDVGNHRTEVLQRLDGTDTPGGNTKHGYRFARQARRESKVFDDKLDDAGVTAVIFRRCQHNRRRLVQHVTHLLCIAILGRPGRRQVQLSRIDDVEGDSRERGGEFVRHKMDGVRRVIPLPHTANHSRDSDFSDCFIILQWVSFPSDRCQEMADATN